MNTELAKRRAEGWTEVGERGSVLAIRFVVFITTFFGRALGRLVARGVAFYYWLFAAKARLHAAAFLSRMNGRPARASETFRQVLRFAQTTLDAFFLVAGKTAHFQVRTNGQEHLAELKQKKRGAILLGAHLGSFYAMRAQSDVEGLPLYAVVYTQNARRINDALESIDPGKNAKLIQMGEGVDFVLKIRELIESGAIVAILADRVPKSADPERVVSVPFLGQNASFPAGPYLLASMLKCPVYLTFGLYRDPNTYELYCEPFAERIELPRGDRASALRAYAARYAERLEHYCRLAPDNWFNFFDFWER
jgi:predicted LPLAT superfamily acyltransferase